MLKPLEQFICDTCGEIITSPNEGWFEWLKTWDDKRKNTNFRICHNKRECQVHLNERNEASMHLGSFLGIDGIIRLLNFIDVGKYFEDNKNYKGAGIDDFRDFTEVFRRLTIPYYEEARLYLEIDGSDGNNEIAFYQPDRLRWIVEEHSRY